VDRAGLNSSQWAGSWELASPAEEFAMELPAIQRRSLGRRCGCEELLPDPFPWFPESPAC